MHPVSACVGPPAGARLFGGLAPLLHAEIKSEMSVVLMIRIAHMAVSPRCILLDALYNATHS